MSKADKLLRELTGYRLRRANMAAEAKFNRLFADYGLRRTTFSVLSLVVDNPGLRQSDLAAALSIERPNLVQIIDELEAEGLMVREVAANDRRAYALQATVVGRRMFSKVMAGARTCDSDLTQGLSSDQINVLQIALDLIETRTETREDHDELKVSRA